MMQRNGEAVRSTTVQRMISNRYDSKRPDAVRNSVKALQPDGERTPFHEKGVSVDWSARTSVCRSREYFGQWNKKWSRFSFADLHAGHTGSEPLSIEKNSFRGATFSANW